MPKKLPTLNRKLVEFRDKPAARSGNTSYIYDDFEPANGGKKKPEAGGLITQTEIIEFNLMKLERARLFREMKKWRTDIQARLARGATVEPGPHSAEVVQNTTIQIDGRSR